MRIGIVDTGVNPWHSHVRGEVDGCRIHVAQDGSLAEDRDFRDPAGHGTAVAGVIREALPDASLYAVRVFDGADATFPSLVARGILRAAAEGCDFVNLSLCVPPGPGAHVLAGACAAAIEAGCVIVASARPGETGWLPASLPGVYAVSADDSLDPDDVRERGPFRLAASGRPRALGGVPRERNFLGPSFACARALVHLARRRRAAVIRSA
ncbi:Subtilisin DY [Burkholderiales bacterium]|nr:Subtilisin DY [Burkholderiales bacterium]